MIIELRCGHVIKLWSAKEKTCTPSNLNSICLAQSNKYFAPIIPGFLTMEFGLMCVFLTNTEITACVQLPPPLRKNCCAQATEIIEWACRH